MYIFVKFVHVVSIILWFAGLLMLAQIFLQQIRENSANLITLSQQTYKKLILPASMIATALGLYLAFELKFKGGFIHSKILLVIILWGLQMLAKKMMIDFSGYKVNIKRKQVLIYFGAINGIFLIMVFLAIVKPF